MGVFVITIIVIKETWRTPIARLEILKGWIKVERAESTSGACDSHADPNFCLARVHRSLAHDCKVPVSFGRRPAKQMLFPYFYSTLDVSFRVDFGQGFRKIGCFTTSSDIFFFPIRKSRPIVT